MSTSETAVCGKFYPSNLKEIQSMLEHYNQILDENLNEEDSVLHLKPRVDSMIDVLNVKAQNEIPELNVYQCGAYKMHSLDDAKNIAKNILNKKVSIMKNEELTLGESLVEVVE